MVFQWFPMVANHWSDDGMVTIHRSGLLWTNPYKQIGWIKRILNSIKIHFSQRLPPLQRRRSLHRAPPPDLRGLWGGQVGRRGGRPGDQVKFDLLDVHLVLNMFLNSKAVLSLLIGNAGHQPVLKCGQEELNKMERDFKKCTRRVQYQVAQWFENCWEVFFFRWNVSTSVPRSTVSGWRPLLRTAPKGF